MTTTSHPDLFDATTLASLSATVVLLGVAWALAALTLPAGSAAKERALFVWHAFDALIHFVIEGSFVWLCFFSWIDAGDGGPAAAPLAPTAHNFLGAPEGRAYGPQAGGDNPFAHLWMVYARADRRYGGADTVGCALSSSSVHLWLPRIIFAFSAVAAAGVFEKMFPARR